MHGLADEHTLVLLCGAVGPKIIAAFNEQVDRFFERQVIDTKTVDTVSAGLRMQLKWRGAQVCVRVCVCVCLRALTRGSIHCHGTSEAPYPLVCTREHGVVSSIILFRHSVHNGRVAAARGARDCGDG
jgi:hypothetical protein